MIQNEINRYDIKLYLTDYDIISIKGEWKRYHKGGMFYEQDSSVGFDQY